MEHTAEPQPWSPDAALDRLRALVARYRGAVTSDAAGDAAKELVEAFAEFDARACDGGDTPLAWRLAPTPEEQLRRLATRLFSRLAGQHAPVYLQEQDTPIIPGVTEMHEYLAAHGFLALGPAMPKAVFGHTPLEALRRAICYGAWLVRGALGERAVDDLDVPGALAAVGLEPASDAEFVWLSMRHGCEPT